MPTVWVFLLLFVRGPQSVPAYSTILKPSRRWTSHGTVGRFWSSWTGNASRGCCVTAPLLWTVWTLKPTRLFWQPAACTSAPSSWNRKMLCIWTSATQQVGSRLAVISHFYLLLQYKFHFVYFLLCSALIMQNITTLCVNNSKCM